MYLIIDLAIGVAMLSMLLIKRLDIKSVDGKLIKYEPKPYHTGVIIGGMLFCAGWAITGACPGPIYAQIGAVPGWPFSRSPVQCSVCLATQR